MAGSSLRGTVFGLMAHCRNVDDDAEVALTQQVFPLGEGARIFPMPHDQFEIGLYPEAYAKVALGGVEAL